MGFYRAFSVASAQSSAGVLVVLTLLGLAGCQATTSQLAVDRMLARAWAVNPAGLQTAQDYPSLNITAEVPKQWDAAPEDSNVLYTHLQWRSHTRSTGVGVAYIHMPLPMSAKSLIWLAKSQYQKQSPAKVGQGRQLGQWTDSMGREWFEAENEKYHVKGYAVVKGFDAWIVYTGYRLRGAPNQAEISLATRSMDSIIPIPLKPN